MKLMASLKDGDLFFQGLSLQDFHNGLDGVHACNWRNKIICIQGSQFLGMLSIYSELCLNHYKSSKL